MRFRGLGDDPQIGAVARGPERDRETDAARGARDEEGFTLEIRHRRSPVYA